MKTSELTGTALDWAVAKGAGNLDRAGEVIRIGNQLWCWEYGERMRYSPSDCWAQGGPIIEREGISIGKGDKQWAAFANADDEEGMLGTTSLIAAMRCYVASKLGDEVDVPEELV